MLPHEAPLALDHLPHVVIVAAGAPDDALVLAHGLGLGLAHVERVVRAAKATLVAAGSVEEEEATEEEQREGKSSENVVGVALLPNLYSVRYCCSLKGETRQS